MESIGGLWGRQVQYGEPPDNADEAIGGPDDSTSPTRREVVAMLRELSALGAAVEQAQPNTADDQERIKKYRRLLEMFIRAFRRQDLPEGGPLRNR